MNRNVIFLLLGGALLIGVVFWLIDGGSDTSGRNYHNNWNDEYGTESLEPRGLGFFQRLVSVHTGDTIYTATQPEHIWSIRPKEKLNFYFIGEALGFTELEYDSLLWRVRRGSNLILCFEDISQNIYSKFLRSNGYTWIYAKEATIRSGADSATCMTVYQNDTIFSDWYPFKHDRFIDSVEPLLNFREFNVAISLKVGKGQVILHSIPKLFQNYQVNTKPGYFNASTILNTFGRKQGSVYLKFADANDFDPYALENGPGEDQSYINYIMQRAGLRWALILIIIALLLYVIFRAKRRQNVIPPVPEKRDMTLAFVETLGTIYLSRNNPYGTLQVMKRNFYTTVNRFFYVDLLAESTREQEVQRLKLKSGYDEEELTEILRGLEVSKADQATVTNRMLGELHARIRKFYLATGIIHAETDEHLKTITIHRNLIPGSLLVLGGGLFILRALYLLALSGGIGIVILPVAIIVLAIGIRVLSLPAAVYAKKELKVYRILGKPIAMKLSPETHIQETIAETVFANQDDERIVISHRLLGNNGRRELRRLTQQFKSYEP